MSPPRIWISSILYTIWSRDRWYPLLDNTEKITNTALVPLECHTPVSDDFHLELLDNI